jgi:hypothetical protein
MVLMAEWYHIVLLAVLIGICIASVWQVYVLYSQADYVKCDQWGNCQFTTVRSYGTCYENGKQVNCTKNIEKYMDCLPDMNGQIPRDCNQTILDEEKARHM